MNKVILIQGKLKAEDGVRIVREIAEASCDERVKTIVFLIHSGGGSIQIINNVWDAVKNCDKQVVAVGMYEVASTAAAIFMMANRRILCPYTGFVVHEASITDNSEKQWYKRDFEREMKNLEESTKTLLAPVLENSTIPEEVLRKQIAYGDWVIGGDLRREYNIITEEYDVKEVMKLIGNISI